MDNPLDPMLKWHNSQGPGADDPAIQRMAAPVAWASTRNEAPIVSDGRGFDWEIVFGRLRNAYIAVATDKEKARLCGPGLPVIAGAQTETGCILCNVESLSKDCANCGKHSRQGQPRGRAARLFNTKKSWRRPFPMLGPPQPGGHSNLQLEQNVGKRMQLWRRLKPGRRL
jgi:hypothetical protein